MECRRSLKPKHGNQGMSKDEHFYPEVRDWDSAVVGKFYRPIKKPLTLRIDADVLAWLNPRERDIKPALIKSFALPCWTMPAGAERKPAAPMPITTSRS